MPNSRLEYIYYELPWFLKDFFYSLNELRIERRRYGDYFKFQLEELKKSEWWSREKILEYKNNHFLDIFNYSYKYIPFYNELYKNHGINIKQIQSIEDIKKLPIIKKSYLKENLSKFSAKSRIKNSFSSYLTSALLASR